MLDLILFLAIFIVAIIQIIIIVKFFQIASDIRQINYGKTGRDYLNQAEMYAFIGKNDLAIENYNKALYRFIHKDDHYVNAQRDITDDIIKDIEAQINQLRTKTE